MRNKQLVGVPDISPDTSSIQWASCLCSYFQFSWTPCIFWKHDRKLWKKHTLPHCTGNSPWIDWKHHSQGIRRQQHTQSQLPVKTFFFCVVAQSIVGYCNISNNIKGKLNYEISKSAARLKRHPHTEAWRQMMQCHGSCECLHGSQNSHYWHSSLYPRSTERSYKNNEVQQTRNNKRVSAVNSMECLSKRVVLIFSLLENVLK